MIEQLFGSKTRVKLLKLFYGNPNRAYYVREITRKIDEQINSVRRELSNLLTIGIISSETTNNRLYYEVNQDYEYYDALSAIFGKGGKASSVKVIPTEVAEENKDLQALGHVEFALYTGQFTRDESSGVDLLVVGDVNPTKVQNFVSELESKENKEIRYAVMSPSEFKYRSQIHDRFITAVLSAKVQVLIDTNNVLTKPASKPAAKLDALVAKASKKSTKAEK